MSTLHDHVFDPLDTEYTAYRNKLSTQWHTTPYPWYVRWARALWSWC